MNHCSEIAAHPASLRIVRIARAFLRAQLSSIPDPRSPILFLVALTLGSGKMAAQTATPDYHRAERLINWNLTPIVYGEAGEPNWLSGERFWYRVNTARGAEFVLIDPVRNSRQLVFDNSRLAAAMSVARDTSYDPLKLPITTFEFIDVERRIRFRSGRVLFKCDVTAYRCETADTTELRPAHHVPSPDGKWEAFIHGHDLYARAVGGRDSLRLTTDGQERYRYGVAYPRPSEIVSGNKPRPTLEWSPDSKRIAVQRLDERSLGVMPLYSSTSQRPRSYLYPYSLPGDSAVSAFEIYLVDLEKRCSVKVQLPSQPIPMSGFAGMQGDSNWLTVKWNATSDKLYFTHHVRARKRVQLQEADLDTGAPGPVLARDTGATFVELNLLRNGPPNWFVLNGGREIIWFSERDGWGHLFLYDGAGKVKNQITSGAWAVADVVYIDETARTIYFTARGREPGRNPYYRHFYRVRFDGTGLALLAPEDADHTVHASRSGRFFIDRYSGADKPGAAVLRAADGSVVRKLEQTDVSRLGELGWKPPEIVTVKARDGVTDLYGLLFKPSNLDPAKKYPVIVNVYPGPQIGSVGNWGFEAGRTENHGLAELGFVVIQVDALGTPYRSKAFHDFYHGNMGDNGLPDQIGAVRQLGMRLPYLDLDRVGIYGHSGGGFASTDAILRYPDFFKVAVSSSGNHDNRSYGHYWGEQYQGLLRRDTVRGGDNYANQVNATLAGNLKGSLFLMHGDMDDNVHPAMTLQVADALIRANKSFDLLLLPNRAHGLNEPYVIRRRWDYFVEHLLGAKPPVNFEIKRPQ